MGALKKLVGAYLVGVAVVVAAHFIINPFLAEVYDVLRVWLILDIFMAVALALGLAFNYTRQRAERRHGADAPVTRSYLEANVAFYVTASVTVLFLSNWFAFLAFGAVSVGDNHTAWVIWALVDTGLPLVLGVTGCRLWQESSMS